MLGKKNGGGPKRGIRGKRLGVNFIKTYNTQAFSDNK